MPRQRLVWWLALVGATAGLWWTLWPTLRAPFGMADDHNIIDMTAPAGRMPWSAFPRTVGSLTGEHDGRFRPLYAVGQAFEAALAGRNAQWWYLDRLALATVVLVCLYVVLSRVAHPVPAAMIALLPFSGPQVEVWTRLGTAEAYAMPLAAGGLALVLRPALRGRTNPAAGWPGYLLLVGAGLAKENFVTLGPVLCLLLVVLAWPRLTRWDWVVVGGVAGAAVVDIGAILLKVHRYGTVYPQVRTVGAVAAFVGRFAKYESVSGLLPVALIVVVVLVWRSRPREQRSAWFVLAGVLLLVVPQVYLNEGTSAEGRYLYPMVLALVLLWGYAAWLGARAPYARHVSLLLAVLLVLPLAIGSAYGRSEARDNASTASAFQGTIRRVEAAAEARHTRIVVTEPSDPYWDYEPVESYAAYLAADGFRVETMPTPIPSREAPSPYFRGLAADIDRWSADGSTDLEPLSAHRTPCVSITWDEPARRCSAAVAGYDARP